MNIFLVIIGIWYLIVIHHLWFRVIKMNSLIGHLLCEDEKHKKHIYELDHFIYELKKEKTE